MCLRAFVVGTLRTLLYLTLAWIKKNCSKVFFFHLPFTSELSVCPIVNLDVVRQGIRVRLVTCELQVITVVVTL